MILNEEERVHLLKLPAWWRKTLNTLLHYSVIISVTKLSIRGCDGTKEGVVNSV